MINIEKEISRQITYIGDDTNRDGLVDTPKRIRKMWNEIFIGYNDKKKPKITTFTNGTDGILYDQMIVDSGNFYSMCEHHMLPFFGEYFFAYVPDKNILGISKVARIVNFFSAKLQIQERLNKEILDEIEKIINPKGIALVMRARHLCKEMRGVKNKGKMITSDLRGVFKTKPEAREEFMRLFKND